MEDLLLIALLLVTAIAFRVARGPTPSRMFPGTMTMSESAEKSDPPSMDELWHLALSTGRGSPFDGQPRDVLIRGVPAWTALDDARPWWTPWVTMERVTHPPLYVETLRLWREAFGSSDGVAIAYSVMWSCVALLFIYLAVGSAAGRAAAFWAAAVYAVSPIATYFALEIRGYAMLVGESAIALWLLVRLTRHGPRPRDVVGLCAVLLACMLTHYFSVFACLLAGAYTLAISGRRWPRVLAAGVITGVVYAIVWLPFLLQQLRFVPDAIGFLQTDGPQYLHVSQLAAALPMRLLAESWIWPPLGVSSCLCLALLAAVVVLAVKQPTARPFVVWYIGVVGFLYLSDLLRQTQQVAFIRYPSAAQPAVAAFVPLVIAGFVRRRWAEHVAGLALCVTVLVLQPRAVHNDAPTCTPALSRFATRMKPDDVLLLAANMKPGESEYTTDAMLLEFAHVPGLFPRDAAILYKPVSPELASQLGGRRAWVLTLEFVDTPSPDFTPGARVLETTSYWVGLSSRAPCKAYLVEFPAAPSATTRSL